MEVKMFTYQNKIYFKTYFILQIILVLFLQAPCSGHAASHVHDLLATGLDGTPAADVAISGGLRNDTASSNLVTYLPDNTVTVDFIFDCTGVNAESTAVWYVAAHYGDKWYMKDEADIWRPWDGSIDHMIAARRGPLAEKSTISFSGGPGLGPGEYAIYGGISINGGPLVYGRKAVAFMVFDNSEDASMHRVQHGELLENFLNSGLVAQKRNYLYMEAEDILSPQVSGQLDGGVTAQGENSETGTPFSRTNLQEAGVDEADIVKSDGKTLFRVDWCRNNSGTVCLKSDLMVEDPPSTRHLDTLELKGEASLGTMYLLSDRPENRPDLIVYISSASHFCCPKRAPYVYYPDYVRLIFIDVSRPDDMAVIKKMDIDGSLIATRMVGEYLYLVTETAPVVPIYYHDKPMAATTAGMPGAEAPAVESVDGNVPDFVPVDKLLPKVKFDDNESVPLTHPLDCFIPVLPPDIYPDPSLVTVTAIPVYDPPGFRSVTVAGHTDAVYVSGRSIYLADSSTYSRPIPVDGVKPMESSGVTPSGISETAMAMPRPVYETFTKLYKFTVENGEISYAAAGRVPGNLGYHDDKKSFRMSEYDNYLRIVTSRGETWDNTSETVLFVLAENREKHALEIKGKLDGLGLRGERLYAARFSGGRGFIVTFKVTDPLYILDLSDPENPRVAGELHINGYSDYLYKLTDNLLLGIGKDAIPDDSSPDMQGRGAWYQGVKLSLYDISSGSEPREIRSVVIGKRGTESGALQDHHALTWLVNGESVWLAMPIELADSPPEYEGLDIVPDMPNIRYSWTRTGLWLFEITTGPAPELSKAGEIVAVSRDDTGNSSYFRQRRSTWRDRSVIAGNAVYYIHDGRIISGAFRQ